MHQLYLCRRQLVQRGQYLCRSQLVQRGQAQEEPGEEQCEGRGSRGAEGE